MNNNMKRSAEAAELEDRDLVLSMLTNDDYSLEEVEKMYEYGYSPELDPELCA